MNLKKITIISVIGIFLLNFLFHNLYEFCPCYISSIFFPINESIFEHMKMLFSSIIFFSLIKYFLIKINKININNFITSVFLEGILIIPIYLLMFLPLYYTLGHNMFITISLMLISIILAEVISYFILTKKEIKYLNFISLILIILTYILFAYLTYNPLNNDLFYYF
ncbi:MAG: DUF6512 family protein [Mycoplasmatota bacterium]